MALVRFSVSLRGPSTTLAKIPLELKEVAFRCDSHVNGGRIINCWANILIFDQRLTI